MDKYKDGDTIFILMTAEQCKSVMREWLEHNYECDLNVMRSQKNKGKFVLKTKSLMWSNRIIQWHHQGQDKGFYIPGSRTDIQRLVWQIKRYVA